MDELDADACVQIVRELAESEGDVVFSHRMEARGMASGASAVVYRWKDWYFRYSEMGSFAGPFGSLAESLDETCTVVSYLTERIDCTELSADALIELLSGWPEADPDNEDVTEREFTANGVKCRWSADGSVTRLRPSRSKLRVVKA